MLIFNKKWAFSFKHSDPLPPPTLLEFHSLLSPESRRRSNKLFYQNMYKWNPQTPPFISYCFSKEYDFFSFTFLFCLTYHGFTPVNPSRTTLSFMGSGPKGTMSCRMQGIFVRPSVRTYVRLYHRLGQGLLARASRPGPPGQPGPPGLPGPPGHTPSGHTP